MSNVSERVGGDELGPAEDDVVVPLLTTLVDRGQQLLELFVDDPHPYLKKMESNVTRLTTQTFAQIKYFPYRD